MPKNFDIRLAAKRLLIAFIAILIGGAISITLQYFSSVLAVVFLSIPLESATRLFVKNHLYLKAIVLLAIIFMACWSFTVSRLYISIVSLSFGKYRMESINYLFLAFTTTSVFFFLSIAMKSKGLNFGNSICYLQFIICLVAQLLEIRKFRAHMKYQPLRILQDY